MFCILILTSASTPFILGKSRMRKRAGTDLCGGRSAMVVPTATVIGPPPGRQSLQLVKNPDYAQNPPMSAMPPLKRGVTDCKQMVAVEPLFMLSCDRSPVMLT
jgi:hypothetical protein